ncbi:hypothetical protein CsSME_00012872 [Camellia sinensis var. sinensis]
MAFDSNFVQAAIPRFDGHYDHWSMLMENVLRTSNKYSLDRCPENRVGREKAQRFESQKLPFSGN